MLDLFSGVCAVPSAVAPQRQVWTNDLQVFAHQFGYAHFCSKTQPKSRIDAAAIVGNAYRDHLKRHLRLAAEQISHEERCLREDSLDELNLIYERWRVSVGLGCSGPSKQNYTLFRDTFSGSFFSLSQCVEIDSLRYAFDRCFEANVVDKDQHTWLLLALAVAAGKCSTTTGHFAQALAPKARTIGRFRTQRFRSIWDAWLQAIDNQTPVGLRSWRKNNHSYNKEALELMRLIAKRKKRHPAIVYADPPYTADQYSRYYHVYETLMLYDYPSAEGRGRYRPDRAVSQFSLRTRVEEALASLIKLTADSGAELVLSYPTNGLLTGSREAIPDMIRQHFGRAPIVREIEHLHSTMGASKGPQKHAVTEVIYRAVH